ALGPDAPAVALHDARDDGEADARPLELVGRVQALERAEQLARVAAVEADPVVRDGVDADARGGVACDGDARLLAPARVLDRVADQVEEHALDQRAISARGWQRREREL